MEVGEARKFVKFPNLCGFFSPVHWLCGTLTGQCETKFCSRWRWIFWKTSSLWRCRGKGQTRFVPHPGEMQIKWTKTLQQRFCIWCKGLRMELLKKRKNNHRVGTSAPETTHNHQSQQAAQGHPCPSPLCTNCPCCWIKTYRKTSFKRAATYSFFQKLSNLGFSEKATCLSSPDHRKMLLQWIWDPISFSSTAPSSEVKLCRRQPPAPLPHPHHSENISAQDCLTAKSQTMMEGQEHERCKSHIPCSALRNPPHGLQSCWWILISGRGSPSRSITATTSLWEVKLNYAMPGAECFAPRSWG